MIALSQAKQRLRGYYTRVNKLVRDYISEHGDWALLFDGQDVVENMYFANIGGNRQCLTADIKLTKDDGSSGNVTGNYSGHFHLLLEYDLNSYVTNYAQQCMEIVRAGMRSIKWSVAIDEGAKPECYQTFEGEAYQLQVSLPYGVNRAFIEMPIPNQPMFVADYKLRVERTVRVEGTDLAYFEWRDLSVSFNDYININNDMGEAYSSGELIAAWDHSMSEEFHPLPPEVLQMTLIIDMLE